MRNQVKVRIFKLIDVRCVDCILMMIDVELSCIFTFLQLISNFHLQLNLTLVNIGQCWSILQKGPTIYCQLLFTLHWYFNTSVKMTV
jgi:hypothetical protein